MKSYIAIDLKSFYASVECVDRGLNPLNTNLVVADKSRTEKTICLAVSPSLKAYGISGRARLFEVVQRVGEVNAQRLSQIRGKDFSGSSCFADELAEHPEFKLDYITAPPRMARYIEVSSKIYGVYLNYIAPEDMHVYSVDEVFIDATKYLRLYNMTAYELADKIVRDVLSQTGITATAGIGTNLYLCKIAMDIYAKRIKADKDGVRIAELDEKSYREQLWSHTPITDFWRIGRGYSRTLGRCGMFTMGDVARCSIVNEELLFKLFGVNAELLIDHAWGREPCTMEDIKSYRPKSQSLSSGQVLSRPYDFDEAKLIAREMTELLALDLVDKKLLTDQIVLTVGYDIENLKDKNRRFNSEIKTDYYGRQVPKGAHGSQNIGRFTSSTSLIMNAVMKLFDRVTDHNLLVRRMYIVANHITTEDEINTAGSSEQMNLFDGVFAEEKEHEEDALRRERAIQKTILRLHKRFGKNSVLKGMNLKEAATSIERNSQIGGHKA
ncbi:MAG: DNA methylase [Ruminococcus sp.]|nr:DNA methylase [Ruminococcus sp.]